MAPSAAPMLMSRPPRIALQRDTPLTPPGSMQAMLTNRARVQQRDGEVSS